MKETTTGDSIYVDPNLLTAKPGESLTLNVNGAPNIEHTLPEYIILYNTNEYKFMQAPNSVGLCKLWYEYVEDEMTGVTLRIWEKFKPEEFEDCIAWINSLLYPSNRIDGVIHGMWQTAKPSKE